MLQIANVVNQTEAEGPGLRAAIWFQGCTLNCPGCCNPTYLAPQGGTPYEPVALAHELSALDVEGITLLGGEPLQQVEPLITFLDALRAISDKGVMLFTGYSFPTIERMPRRLAAVQRCDLVVAGPYLQNLPDHERRWIGSRNQTVHFITERYAALNDGWEPHRNEVEIHIRDGELVVNGTPIDLGMLEEGDCGQVYH